MSIYSNNNGINVSNNNNNNNASSNSSNNNINVREGNLAMILEMIEESAAAGAGRPENVYRKYNVVAKNYNSSNAKMASNIRQAGVNAAKKLNASFTSNNISTKSRKNKTRKNKRS